MFRGVKEDQCVWCVVMAGTCSDVSKMNILRDRYTITEPIKDFYMNPSINLLRSSKNSICQGRSLSSLTSTLSSRKLSMESQITIMVLLGKQNIWLVNILLTSGLGY